jgi:hypothetical protein
MGLIREYAHLGVLGWLMWSVFFQVFSLLNYFMYFSTCIFTINVYGGGKELCGFLPFEHCRLLDEGVPGFPELSMLSICAALGSVLTCAGSKCERQSERQSSWWEHRLKLDSHPWKGFSGHLGLTSDSIYAFWTSSSLNLVRNAEFQPTPTHTHMPLQHLLLGLWMWLKW